MGTLTDLNKNYKGDKHNKDKELIECIHPHLLLDVGQVFTFGAQKYGKWNFAKGIPEEELYAAAMRHLLKWYGEEIYDTETKLPHLAHAVANLVMLYWQDTEIADMDNAKPSLGIDV